MSVPAGWYADPVTPSVLRYWDGAQWTEHTQPARPATQAQQQVSNTAGGAGGFLGMGKRKAMESENAQLREVVARLGAGDVVAIDAERIRLQDEVARLRIELVKLTQERSVVQADLVEARDRQSLQSFGLFDYRNPAQDSVQLGGELDSVRAQIKEMVRRKTAIEATTNFTFNNSAAKGRSFVNNMSKIMLRAYNAEAENAVKTVKAGNLESALNRLGKAVAQIERNGTMIDLRVNPTYHALRQRELSLAAQFLDTKRYEREMERERRAELREQQRAAQELTWEREKLLKERQHYLNVLEALIAKGDSDGADRVRLQLADADDRIADVDYRIANVRAGYVYVISNVGAFGGRMVKIGMTRRLEPSDRVKELGDASVPFRFDTHALFFSSDAVALEGKLHQAFEDRRVNKVNPRREFFYATPEEVLDVLRREVAEVVEFVSIPAAEEFRLSGGVVVSEPV